MNQTKRQKKQLAIKSSLLKGHKRMSKRNPEKAKAFADRWQRIEDKKQEHRASH